MIDDQIYTSFHNWVSEVLIDVPDDISGFVFNIYEEEDEYCIDIIGTSEFSEDSDEWANQEVWNSGSLMFIIPKEKTTDWEEVHDLVADSVDEILTLEDDDTANCLMTSEGIAVGFIDGELEYIWTY